MRGALQTLDQIDRAVTGWMARNGLAILRVSLGIVFLWFGVLKFFPGISPAQELAARTIKTLSFGYIEAEFSLPMLATWESVIGMGLILGVFVRGTLFLLFLQMSGTLMPLLLFPADTFLRIPYAPTLEGQYIIKNLVLISAGIVIGATARGGRLTASPGHRREA